MKFCNCRSGGWFLAARAAMLASRIMADPIAFDPAITDENKNFEFGDMRKGD